MDEGELDGLAQELTERLAERGVPAGNWLVEIAEVRAALRAADDLLRRMEMAIVRSAARQSRPGGRA